jgi:plastin-3
MLFERISFENSCFFYLVSFVANLFNTYPNLDLPTEKEIQPELVIEETREEKTYRNFINGFGLSPHVNYLYSDLQDGLVILQVRFLQFE